MERTRTVEEIKKQIKKLRDKDRHHNNHSKSDQKRNKQIDGLVDELSEAQNLKFKQKWSLDFFSQQNEIWHKKLREIALNQGGKSKSDQLMICRDETGISDHDLRKAKKLLVKKGDLK